MSGCLLPRACADSAAGTVVDAVFTKTVVAPSCKQPQDAASLWCHACPHPVNSQAVQTVRGMFSAHVSSPVDANRCMLQTCTKGLVLLTQRNQCTPQTAELAHAQQAALLWHVQRWRTCGADIQSGPSCDPSCMAHHLHHSPPPLPHAVQCYCSACKKCNSTDHAAK